MVALGLLSLCSAWANGAHESEAKMASESVARDKKESAVKPYLTTDLTIFQSHIQAWRELIFQQKIYLIFFGILLWRELDISPKIEVQILPP